MTKRTPTNSPGGIIVVYYPETRGTVFDPYTVVEKKAHVITDGGWLSKAWYNAFTISRSGDVCPHFEIKGLFSLESYKRKAIPWAKLPRAVRAGIKRDFKDEWKHTVLAHS